MIKLSNCNMNLPDWNYCVISKKIYTDLGECSTYGIGLSAPNAMTLHDISTCKETVVNMVELFNKHQISPAHAKDVVEDMIS